MSCHCLQAPWRAFCSSTPEPRDVLCAAEWVPRASTGYLERRAEGAAHLEELEGNYRQAKYWSSFFCFQPGALWALLDILEVSTMAKQQTYHWNNHCLFYLNIDTLYSGTRKARSFLLHCSKTLSLQKALVRVSYLRSFLQTLGKAMLEGRSGGTYLRYSMPLKALPVGHCRVHACSAQETHQVQESGLPAEFFLIPYSWSLFPVLLNSLWLHVTKRYCLLMAQDTMVCLSVIDTLTDWTSVKILGFIQNSMKLRGIFSY